MNKILIPNARQIDWYKRKTAFIHFSVNTFTGNEWGDGTESPALFCPEIVDCEQWMNVLVKSGFTHAILTAKHHDGFCLWPSKYTEHSVKNSPYKNGKGDVVKEFTDACRKFGIKPGLYLSPWDRNFADWGTEKYNDYYANQLTELMTEYGPIYECWWDGAGSTEADYDWERWANIVRTNQKECIIFGSLGATPFVDVRWVGNELGKAADNCYATIDASSLETECGTELFTGKADGNRYIPAECDMSIRPGWFYHEDQDALVKTPVQLVDYWFNSYGKNCGILLNIPPDKSGKITDNDANSLIEWNRKMNAIFSTDLLADLTATVDSGDTVEHLSALNDAQLQTPAAITYTFEQATEINCIKIGEKIEYGNRISDFTVEAKVDNEWQTLSSGKTIGNCFARHFDVVTATAIRLTLNEAADRPLLEHFGAYHVDPAIFKEEFETNHATVDLCSLSTAKIINNQTELEIEFGGIYPFNTVIFNAEGLRYFEIFAFNGAQYESVYYGVSGTAHEICRFQTVEGSYKFKIVAYECEGFSDEIKPKVFLQ